MSVREEVISETSRNLKERYGSESSITPRYVHVLCFDEERNAIKEDYDYL
jgi:hypothetical protein